MSRKKGSKNINFNKLYSEEKIINILTEEINEKDIKKSNMKLAQFVKQMSGQLGQRIRGLNNNNYNWKRYYKDDRNIIESSFCGEIFYVNNINCGAEKWIENITEFDNNWCYGSVLLNNDFPLSNYILPEKNKSCKKTSCFIIEAEIKKEDLFKITRKYKNFYYNLYKNYLFPRVPDKDLLVRRGIKESDYGDIKNYYYNKNTNSIRLYLNNIDWNIFTGLYKDIKYKIINRYYFQEVGKLPEEVKEFINHYQAIKLSLKKKRKESELMAEIYKEYKITLEAVVYGKNAEGNKKIKKYNFNDIGLRKEFSSIASFQAAYARNIEYQLFIKYNEYCFYMNGDSFFTNSPEKIEDINNKLSETEIGKWKKEFENSRVAFLNRNGYIAINKNNKVESVCFSGAVKDLIKEELQGKSNKDLIEFINSDLPVIDIMQEIFRKKENKIVEQSFSIVKKLEYQYNIFSGNDLLLNVDIKNSIKEYKEYCDNKRNNIKNNVYKSEILSNEDSLINQIFIIKGGKLFNKSDEIDFNYTLKRVENIYNRRFEIAKKIAEKSVKSA